VKKQSKGDSITYPHVLTQRSLSKALGKTFIEEIPEENIPQALSPPSPSGRKGNLKELVKGGYISLSSPHLPDLEAKKSALRQNPLLPTGTVTPAESHSIFVYPKFSIEVKQIYRFKVTRQREKVRSMDFKRDEK
jgi:hypothetical protein